MRYILKNNKVQKKMDKLSEIYGKSGSVEMASSLDIFKKRAHVEVNSLQDVFDDEQYLLQYSLQKDMSTYATNLDK